MMQGAVYNLHTMSKTNDFSRKKAELMTIYLADHFHRTPSFYADNMHGRDHLGSKN